MVPRPAAHPVGGELQNASSFPASHVFAWTPLIHSAVSSGTTLRSFDPSSSAIRTNASIIDCGSRDRGTNVTLFLTECHPGEHHNRSRDCLETACAFGIPPACPSDALGPLRPIMTFDTDPFEI